MPTFEVITKTLTSAKGLTNRDALTFHAWNPNGAKARLQRLFDDVRDLVDNHGQPSGWHLAYGSLSGADKFLGKLLDEVLLNGKRRVSTAELNTALRMTESLAAMGEKAVAEKRAELAGGK